MSDQQNLSDRSAEPKNKFVVMSLLIVGHSRSMNPSFRVLKNLISRRGVYMLSAGRDEESDAVRLENLGDEMFLVGQDREPDRLAMSEDKITGENITITKSEGFISARPVLALF